MNTTTGAAESPDDNSVKLTSLYITVVFSVVGLLVSITTHVFTSKCFCCEKHLWGVVVQRCKRDSTEYLPLLGRNIPAPWYRSDNTIILASVLHLFGKLVLVVVNIVYLACTSGDESFVFFSPPGLVNDNNTAPDLKAGENTAHTISYYIAIYEIVTVALLPLNGFLNCWIICWARHQQGGWRGPYLEFVRFCDLQIAAFFAPFANVDLFVLGGGWYMVIVARLMFYAVTFAAAIIAGIRFICAYSFFYCCECACSSEGVKIHNLKHLLLKIAINFVSIALKLLTCSSALATYLTIGLFQPFPVRVTYFVFTMIRGITALFSLTFTATLLRWAVLKENEKLLDTPFFKALERLDNYQPHTHIAFAYDIVTYFGLLGLSSYILNQC